MALRVLPFSQKEFFQQVRLACEGQANWEEPAQVRYLYSYLRQHDAVPRAMVVEAPYVDRHYLEEYTGYYATSLRPPPSKVTRIHFLTDEFSADWLTTRFAAAAADYDSVSDEVAKAYLGFMVVRPIAAAPVGRTVLRPYARNGGRCFGPQRAQNRVHLGGLEVLFEGIPFQQQDQGVAACATTALWSALAKVARNDGMRPSTPLAVTESATRHLASGRVFPSGGLDLQQMVAAIRSAGYSPHAFKPNDEHGLFKAAISTYVRSGIPVILQVRFDDDADSHAIAVVGFRESEPVEDVTAVSQIEVGIGETIVQFAAMTRVYVHDDRLGPYARMHFVQPLEWKGDGEERRQVPRSGVWLRFDPRERGFDGFLAPAFVRQALVPLYPKMRLTAEELLWFASAFVPLMEHLSRGQPDLLRTEARFIMGGAYLKETFALGLATERLNVLLDTILVSRYVGVIRFSVGGNWLGDIVCDSTDLRRHVPRYASVLAIVLSSSDAAGSLATAFDAPNAIIV